MILTVGTSLALSRVMVFERLTVSDVNRTADVRVSAAGKSVNAARVIHALGERVLAVGPVGGCTGQELRDELDRAGVPHDFVESARPTRVCVTVVDRAADSATELVQEPPPISSDESDRLWEKLLMLVPAAKVVVTSGALAPNVPAGFYALVCRLAGDAGAATIVDAKGPEMLATLSTNPTLVKPNRTELAATLNRSVDDDASLRAAMRELIDRGARHVAVTAGAAGVMFTDGSKFRRLVPPTIKPVSPIGSGDAFAGGFAVGLMRGMEPIEAARLGVACGTANALTLQAGFLDRRDVERFYEKVSCEKTD